MRGKGFGWISLIAVILLVGFLSTASELYSEIDPSTGAIRTKTTRALVFTSDWIEKPTWLSLRAKELGLSAQTRWQFFNSKKTGFFMIQRASGRAPESVHVHLLDPAEMESEERDRFVAAFVEGSEEQRASLIRNFIDGSLSTP
jgi:hypothetical protein